MSTILGHSSHVVPAHLSFLAIYNPSLGNTDDSLHEQIVFYSSTVTRTRTRARPTRKNETTSRQEAEKEEENEQLRQVGLAQGMVDFAKWVGQTYIPTMARGREINAAQELLRRRVNRHHRH
jgi:First Longin domain of INTU, CCZ1 and HPS4